MASTATPLLDVLFKEGLFHPDLPPCFVNHFNRSTMPNEAPVEPVSISTMTRGVPHSLTIVHPKLHGNLCEVLVRHKTEIVQHLKDAYPKKEFVSLAAISIINAFENNVVDQSSRRVFIESNLMEYRKLHGLYGKILLKGTISDLYGSIYTHTIAWAAHTKPVAKKDQSDALWGNVIDKAVNSTCYRETHSIPFGTPTSIVISEIILSAVDKQLQEDLKGNIHGFRNGDFYEIVVRSREEAYMIEGRLRSVLNLYKLRMNVDILELPRPVRPLSHQKYVEIISPLAQKAFGDDNEEYMVDLFDSILSVSQMFPREHIVSYVLRKWENHIPDWIDTSFELLLQLLIQEPPSIRILSKYLLPTLIPPKQKLLQEALETFIINALNELSLNNIAWALYVHLMAKVSINMKLKQLDGLDNSIISILLIELINENLVTSDDKQEIETKASDDWLLCYFKGNKTRAKVFRKPQKSQAAIPVRTSDPSNIPTLDERVDNVENRLKQLEKKSSKSSSVDDV